MFKKIRLKHEAKSLKNDISNLEEIIFNMRKILEAGDSMMFASCFYRDLESLEWELADKRERLNKINYILGGTKNGKI